MRKFVDPCDFYGSYTTWLKNESQIYAWWADCFNSAMLTRHKNEKLREFLPVGNFEYVMLLEYMGMSPRKLGRDSCKWGDLGEIIMGRCFSEDRLEFAHGAWHFMKMTAPAGEASRRSRLYTAGDKERAFTPSNWPELFARSDDYSSFTPAELEEINGCLLYTSPSPRDATLSRMPSSA